MRPNRRNSGPLKCKLQSIVVFNAMMWILLLTLTAAEAAQPIRLDSGSPAPQAKPATALSDLTQEAERNNPKILAARRAWQAATQVPSQVSTLPDPKVVVQNMSVGSPRPFAGFTNSNFAYVGFGISQDLPYPGKLRLKGEIAHRSAVASQDHYELVRREVIEQVKAAYFELSYIQQTLNVLHRDQQLLAEVEKIAEARYRVGQGNQQDVLKAQLQETKLLCDVQLYDQQKGTFEARLKQILNRPPDSADLATEAMTQTPFAYTFDQLRSLVASQNPAVRAQEDTVTRQGLGVELARKDFYPDFNVQYMWQHTAEQFRDYYMLTFGVQV
ncbi:MAG: TolC family protein, partial [Terriglobia bacterium]